MTKQNRGYYEATNYLGQYMKKLVPFLNESSCMSVNRRVQLAILMETPKLLETDFDKMTEKELINKVIIPLVKKIGFAEWERDTVTDMAIRKGTDIKTYDWNK